MSFIWVESLLIIQYFVGKCWQDRDSENGQPSSKKKVLEQSVA